MSPEAKVLAEDFNVIWGAESIGKVIGLSRRQVFHLLESGRLRGAKKIGGRWAITKRALMQNFEDSGLALRQTEEQPPQAAIR